MNTMCELNPETIRELLDALRLAQRALNTAPRFRVGETDSYRIAAKLDAALAKVAT
jgi:hypothetical protein